MSTAKQTVTIAVSNGMEIAADEWPGDGPAVVLAHGGGQTRHSWGGTAAALSSHGHRVVSMDLRGHGDSTWDQNGDYSMGAYRDDALAVADWIGEPVAWVGASLGGMTGLIAQGCNKAGLGKVTYGTSGTIDINTGAELKLANGAYPMVLRNQGDSIEFLLEGMVITAGAMFDWLAGGLELVTNPEETAAIAASVPDNGGVFVLPALQGLGTPYGKPEQRAVIGGLSRAATKGHVVRAALEGVASRVREALDQIYVDAPELGSPQSLRVDGGATRNDLLMQIQADILGLPVERHAVAEATALGAAICAGETAGMWDAAMGASLRRTDRIFEPLWSDDQRESFFDNWRRATASRP